MKTVRKACALVVRETTGVREILQLLQPGLEPQLPKGGLEPGEDPREGALRELCEESGLKDVADVRALGVHSIVFPGGPDCDGPLEQQDWYLFVMTPAGALPDAWTHTVQGDGVDRGMEFGYRWIPLDAGAPQRFHPMFHPVVARLLGL